MKLLELSDSISRFRFFQSCVGFTGCLCVCYAVWTPFWLKDRGLWTEWNNTNSDQTTHKDNIIFNVLEAERVFGVLSSLMAVSTGALCLVFALCWKSETVRLFQHTLSPHGRTSPLPHHTAAAHPGLHRILLPPLLVSFHLSAP
ncbi:uncharacterized protein si:ch211-256a21.4 [Anoplopoma fimbria]|uniref:uncharacterized protein si:ch211-256a21.4 n=1 Tax=Anoplopoma fimbria TaxID=229290 RepID=UPI0023EDDA98|nr:uncharacterized protein si:ch211-256a21.4 [Anoplopoma fimbria]